VTLFTLYIQVKNADKGEEGRTKHMIRGWYTGASGMRAQQYRLDALANNLANVDTNAYKKDTSVQKAFGQLLIRRLDDDGVTLNPFGSGDAAPIIGKLGLGVETNELYTDFSQGALKETGSDYDMALDGGGFIAVQTPQGERYTRNGNFTLGMEGYLETKEGFPVLGESGNPIQLQENNFQIDREGTIYINNYYVENPQAMIGETENEWQNPIVLDRLKIVGFNTLPDGERYIEKQGSSLYKASEVSGEAQVLAGAERPGVIQGYLEASNVDPVREMVEMIEVQRAYEANQKSITSSDSLVGVLFNQVVRYQ
jgi:flagellar basal-body rod protein FlgG